MHGRLHGGSELRQHEKEHDGAAEGPERRRTRGRRLLRMRGKKAMQRRRTNRLTNQK